MQNDRISTAVELMAEFLDRTGVTSNRRPRRYLWTDAFAVCNLLALERATGEQRHRHVALRLVDHVHHELGRYRHDDDRTGWLSGLEGVEAEAHPTRGGLRIGKPLPERSASEPFDPTVEWERDGQYFHYLTRWMHALDQVTRSTGRPTFNVWARELADTAHRAFTVGPPGDRCMMWKLSVDLARPLVASMGHHDPLDGFVTCEELAATATELQIPAGPRLERATADFASMVAREELTTADPLGLGGLLVDACLLTQIDPAADDLLGSMLAAAACGLRQFVAEPDLRAPAHLRLAFRELGLAVGLASLPMIERHVQSRPDAPSRVRAAIAELARYAPLRDAIESLWLQPENRRTRSSLEHADINDVMLATSLVPEGVLWRGTRIPAAPWAISTTAAPA